MQFHVDRDAGESIVLWVAPDNPSTTPRILISSPGGQQVEMQANVLRTDLKDLGIHGTGMTGFLVDEQVYPNLGKVSSIEIREAESHVILYRRSSPAQHIERKLFRFDMQVMPQTVLESLFAAQFTLPYHAVERYPFDTLFGIINNPSCNSIYISGRPNFQRYVQLLRDRGFTVVTIMRDPYEELAERLLFIQYASRQQSDISLNQRLTGLAALADVVANLDFGNGDSIAKRFGSLTDVQRRAIANPFVRSLVCGIDEEPQEKHVALALENLATMDLVGLRSRYEDFTGSLQNLMGVDVLGNHPPVQVSWVPIIADSLARVETIKELLALDLALYDYAKEAIENAIGYSDDPEYARRPASARSWLSTLIDRYFSRAA